MRPLLRWTGRLLVVLLLLVVVLAAVLYAVSAYRLNQTYDVAVEDIPVPADSAAVARGRHIAVTRSCGDCHGSALAGSTAIDDPMIGTWSKTDFVRALRQQERPDGSTIDPVMPPNMGQMTDDELTALWRYLQTVEPTPDG